MFITFYPRFYYHIFYGYAMVVIIVINTNVDNFFA